MAIDHEKFEKAVARWADAAAGARGRTTVSIDGKTLRGSAGVQLPAVRLLAAYAHEAGLVLRQSRSTARPTSTRRRWNCWN